MLDLQWIKKWTFEVLQEITEVLRIFLVCHSNPLQI